MRPIRLEIEGFTSFRQRTIVDFVDADLFAFVGPTGAGKSSLIDAMVFALYGTVPRYGDARLVGSVVNQRSARALIDFEFSVGDEAFRLVREVRRQKSGGGTTREARLERVATGEPLFDGDAKQLTSEVEALLGLTREQFTKCVVLPQGDFQRFLHDKPGVRQDLLVQLLGVEVYSRIGELARQRQRAAGARAETLEEQRRELDAVVASETELRSRLAAFERLQGVIDELGPGLAESEAAVAAVQVGLDQIDDQLARLAEVVRPDDLDDLAEAVAELDEELATLKADEQRHSASEEAAEKALSARPHSRADLEAAQLLLQQVADLTERIAKGERMLAEAADLLATSTAALDAAEATVADAEQQLERVRIEQAAAHLSSGLHIGDPCPVCHRTIDEVPTHEAADLAAVDRTRAEAIRRRDEARARYDEDRTRQQSYETTLVARRELRAELERPHLDLAPGQIAEQLAGVVEAEADVAAARLARRAATERREASEKKRTKIARLETGAWNDFDRVRDVVGVLEPPPARRSDLSEAWGDLHAWAEQRRQALVDRRDEGIAARAEIERRHQQSLDVLDRAFEASGLVRPPEGFREIAAAEAARAMVQLEHVEQAKEAAEVRAAERDRATADERVAGEVGALLKSNAFEKWLLDEAMDALVVGGSAKLAELSRGQYALVVDPKSGAFLVLDHENADEVRSARTLSGGETFLASLALALALAEQVADLASHDAPKIESIFLDEGFGTLDPDALDVVVAAIEELQAGGLVVGLVSHVAELAERVPTRFEVAKGPDGSTVERVDR